MPSAIFFLEEEEPLNTVMYYPFLLFYILVQDYSTEGMSESQLKFLQHLREFGLVFQRKVLV